MSESGGRIVGLLSDTHGLLRPEALDALAGADLLVHAGDVGGLHILESLETVAPVRAVRGNTDHGEVADRLPLDDVLDVPVGDSNLRIYVKHIREDIDLDPAAADIDVVVFGHTHRPTLERRDGVIWVNPGSCGPRRFDLPVTVARLGLDGEGRPDIEFVDLPV